MSQTILIVDDDPDIAALLEDGLKEHGYQVVVARDGLQAIQKAGDAKPDLIMLDFNMPGGGGIAAHVCLRELRPTLRTPIIFLTAVPLAEVERSVAMDAHTYFIAKPAGFDSILPVIRQALAPRK